MQICIVEYIIGERTLMSIEGLELISIHFTGNSYIDP